MPINYTNRKGQTYTLYRGQTKTGKPRYYFGRSGSDQGEPVAELPAGFKISESVDGVVSLVKDHLPLIQPAEVVAVEKEVKQHAQARRYRVAVKHNCIEVYEQAGPNYDTLFNEPEMAQLFTPTPDQIRQLQSIEECHAQYTPVLLFFLLDPKQRLFGAKRMCYLGSIDGWLDLHRTGSVEELASTLIPTLGTDQFYELW